MDRWCVCDTSICTHVALYISALYTYVVPLPAMTF